jgi:hypothetical protein
LLLSTMAKRNPLTGRASTLVLQSVKYRSLSIAIAFLLALVLVPLPRKQRLHSGELLIPYRNVETQPRLAPGSYHTDSRTRFENLSPSQREGDGSTGNTVAVVLNWSRFQNVQRIVSLFCGSELDSIMKHILVWNSNPKPLTYLVRDASPYCDRTFYCTDAVARTLNLPLVRKKNYRSSTRWRICISTHDF